MDGDEKVNACLFVEDAVFMSDCCCSCTEALCCNLYQTAAV